jgi:hypothetical protein
MEEKTVIAMVCTGLALSAVVIGVILWTNTKEDTIEAGCFEGDGAKPDHPIPDLDPAKESTKCSDVTKCSDDCECDPCECDPCECYKVTASDEDDE